MCFIKVATNSRDSGDYASLDRDTDEGERRSAPPPAPPQPQPQSPPDMFSSEYSMSGELSAMVTALTHVVSGHGSGGPSVSPLFRSGGGGGSGSGGGYTGNIYSIDSPLSTYSSSSSSSFAGQKRVRDQEESVNQFSEQFHQRSYGGFADFGVKEEMIPSPTTTMVAATATPGGTDQVDEEDFPAAPPSWPGPDQFPPPN
ncbi:hypothetical protein Ccrd_023171 [Cynara cardunculus var. scolymus]|uniref:Uncharacterized protein n=1 Tax=Cynara cardunculus var. scolymus TaxID=59895 RepID=A0A103XXD7_CYNCS|nr:hypothetical protein Ccrd_023171 [Cynara cardunculus var. scolymus]